MNYIELQSKDFSLDSPRRTFTLHCHLIAVELVPFPKLFVSDYIENEGFLARLDFLGPIDINGSFINPEEIFGVKLFSDKSKPVIDILKKYGVAVNGPKTLVFDKFIFLSLKLRISKYNSRKGDVLLESIMDDATLLKYDPHRFSVRDLYFNFQKRFSQTTYVKNAEYQNSLQGYKQQISKPSSNSRDVPHSLKEEQELLLDSVPFDFNSDEFEQSSSMDEDENGEDVRASIQQLPSVPTQNTSQSLITIKELKSLVEKQNFMVRQDEFFCLESKIVAISPSNMKDLISIDKHNHITLRHLNFYLMDSEKEVLKVTLSNNLSILQFLLGDDFTNNSAAQLLKLYYQPGIMDQKISDICKKAKIKTFLVSWVNHQISISDDHEIYLQNWAFFKTPRLDDLN